MFSALFAFRADNWAPDANGNMLTRTEWSGTHTQDWDVANHLTRDTSGATNVQFVYDGDGQRVKKVESSGVTVAYIGHTYEWHSDTGVVKYYYAAGKRVAMRSGSGVYYLYGDHLASTSLALNDYGYQTSRLSYKPFGGTAWFTAVLPTDYGFTGQRFEATTGYIYDFGARYYDPNIGRFISADSVVPGVGNPQALNRYSYVFNNPLKYIDPSGHAQACDDTTGGCGSPGQCTLDDPECFPSTPGKETVNDDTESGKMSLDELYALDGARVVNGLFEQPPGARVNTQEWMDSHIHLWNGKIDHNPSTGELMAVAAAYYKAKNATNGSTALAIISVGLMAASGVSSSTCQQCGTDRPDLARDQGRLKIDPDGASVWCANCLKNGQTQAGAGTYRIKSFDAYETEALTTNLGVPEYTPQYGGPGHFSVFKGGPTDINSALWQRLNQFIRTGTVNYKLK